MSKLLLVASLLLLCGFGRPESGDDVFSDSVEEESPPSLSPPLDLSPENPATLEEGDEGEEKEEEEEEEEGKEEEEEKEEDVQEASLEYSNVKSIKTEAEFREFVSPPRLTLIYFKPEAAKMTPERARAERAFLDAAKNASEYLRWGFDVRVGKMNCEDVEDATSKETSSACFAVDVATRETDAVHFFRKGKSLIELETTTLFDEDSLVANVLTILLINDIPIVETPDEIMKLQDELVGKRNIVFSYYDKIGSPIHRNLMEVAYTYKTTFQFVITSYNDSLAYLPLKNVDLTALPSVKILLLLCAEAEYSPCPIATLPESRFETTSQHDFRTYLDNVLLQPVVEYPSWSTTDSGVALDDDDAETTLKSAFAEERIHEMTISYDSRAERAEEAKKLLKDGAKAMSLEYRGLVGFVLFDRAFQSPSSTDPVSSVVIRFRPLHPDPTSSDPAPAVETFRYDDAFKFDGPALETLKRAVDKIIDPPVDEAAAGNEERATLDDELSSLEDATVRKVLKYLNKNKDVSWKSLVFDEVPQPKKDKKEMKTLLEADGAKPKLVLFYLKTDGAGMTAALAFGAAARRLNRRVETANSLLRVQCMDWPDICEKYGVFSYPVVKVFSRRSGSAASSAVEEEEEEEAFVTRDLRVLIDADVIFAAASLLRLDPALSTGSPEADSLWRDADFAKGQLMRVRGRVGGAAAKTAFSSMARDHHGEAMFLVEGDEDEDEESVSRLCRSSGGVDAVVIFRPWDRLQPRVCLELTSPSHSSSAAAMWSRISAAALRSPLPELNVKTFPAVIRRRLPLLVLFVEESQESKAVVAAREEDSGKNVAARLAKALIDGRNGVDDDERRPEEEGSIGDLSLLNGVEVSWMNVAANPLHRHIFETYHPRGMSRALPAVSYVDLKLGRVVNVPLELALRGGSAWISGAAAKASNYRATSAPLVSAEDLRQMEVLQLEEGNVGPQREHVDFKAKIAAEKAAKKNKTKNRGEGEERDEDEDEDEVKENVDFRGIPKKPKQPAEDPVEDSKASREPSSIEGAAAAAEKEEEEEEDDDNWDLDDEEFEKEVVEMEKFWKNDPKFLPNIIPELKSVNQKRSYNRLIQGLIQRNPHKKAELQNLVVTLEPAATAPPKPRHEEL